MHCALGPPRPSSTTEGCHEQVFHYTLTVLPQHSLAPQRAIVRGPLVTLNLRIFLIAMPSAFRSPFFSVGGHFVLFFPLAYFPYGVGLMVLEIGYLILSVRLVYPK